MERKQQLIELMNTVYNPLNEVNAHKGIIAIVDNMTDTEAYKHWFKLRKWVKENGRLSKTYEVFTNGFANSLLTTDKKFYYVSDSEKVKPIKRNKMLSKWFRNDRLDGTVYVMENETSIFFSNESTEFACKYMDDDLI